MGDPLFSIVIPTRERADTLRVTLGTCLDQDFEDYEVVVCDNASSPATRAVVDEVASPRIRYHRSDEPLAMSANWERAVALARGDYITVVGDDDALMPYALRELARIIDEHDAPDAVQWNRAVYGWPTIAVRSESDFLMLPTGRSCEVHRGRDRLVLAARYELGPDRLPMIYTSVVHRDVVERHRELVGRVFPSIYPDMYSGYAFGFLAERFVSVGVPMGIAGLSAHSNGVATLLQGGGGRIAREFDDLNARAGFVPHPTVPDLGIWPVPLDDSFQYARDLLFAADSELRLDRQQMIERYVTALPEAMPSRDDALDAIRASLADRTDLLPWFDRQARSLTPAPPYRVRPERLGFQHDWLFLDTSRFGVAEIDGAVRLATDLLGIGSQAIEYTTTATPVPPGRRSWSARTARGISATAWRRLRAAVSRARR